MAENKIEKTSILRSVRSLLNERFYVPKYQRGYRWTKKQVEDLLKDIDRFTPSNDEGKNSWYCLQPLVVKQQDGQLRLIDGQQRLTTIKLILTYLNTRFPDDERVDIFSIEYETREKYGDWLQIIDDKEKAEKVIDFSHIYHSYQTIKDWMIDQKKNPNFKISNFREKLLHSCNFIWYDIEQNGQNTDKEEDVFIRLNDGKIALTNSELIKALFLNSSNFAKDKNEEEIRLRQLEISTQWDTIEQELSDNSFWDFINGKENTVRPRIEYLFDVIAQNPKNKEDKDYTFRYFSSKFEENELKNSDKSEFVKQEWENILNTYLVIKEWFKDKYYYHLIGYLLCTNYNIGDLLKEYKENDKDIFRNNLASKIKDTINCEKDKLDTLKYGDGRVRKILLLHNVITMQKQKNETARFPFSYYIELGKYDIEHIHPQNPKMPNAELREDCLKEKQKNILKADLTEKIAKFSDFSNDESFQILHEEIEEYFANGIDENVVDELSNLCLLDAHTNRSYHNDFFPDKRIKILKEDQDGTFIPICTKKVFQKYYTENPNNMTFWENNDREAYLKDIKEKMSVYLK
ncbi:MAG: DUF262 domain-containing protein [Candidatus Symbiothrix sp.]|nr:DUF262 domain-containing protein [Candidatus Symbiothrix sp.]